MYDFVFRICVIIMGMREFDENIIYFCVDWCIDVGFGNCVFGVGFGYCVCRKCCCVVVDYVDC